MSLFENLAKAESNAGLMEFPESNVLFDGTDDLISIDGSDAVGSSFDLERNVPFSVAFRFSLDRTPISRNLFDAVGKYNASTGIGWYVIFVYASGIPEFRFYLGYGPGQYMGARQPFAGVTDKVAFLTYTGGNSTSSFSFTVKDGAGSGSRLVGSAISGSAALASTIRNTTKLKFGNASGNFYKGTMGHLSFWNIALSGSQIDSIASDVFKDKLEENSLFSANCIEYWREFNRLKVKPVKNSAYYGTYEGGMVS